MKKECLTLLMAMFLISSPQSFASQKISWKLDADKGLLEEIKKTLLRPGKEVKSIVQLVYANDINIYADRVTQRIRRVWYFSDSESIQNYATDSLYFDELSESLIVHEAAIIHADGNIVRFDPASAQILDPDTLQVFTNSKKLVIPYSGVELGDVAVLDYELVSYKKDQETNWSTVIYPQLLYPRNKFDLLVHWHDGIKANWSSSSNQVKCSKVESVLTCNGENIPAALTDNNVQWYDELGQIAVSETDSWESVITTATQAFNLSLNNTKGVEKISQDIMGKDDTLEQKIAAIHQFVANKIRYISFSEQGHSITPHTVEETIANRYGDCKDKSAVLVKLLNDISIPAYPVLVATNRRDPSILKTPSMRYFDHMIVCFPYQNNKKCIDATDTYTNWQYTPSWIQGKVALPIIEDQKPTVIKHETYRWDTSVKSKITFLKNGGMIERQRRLFNSTYAGWLRENLANKNDLERKKWMMSQYRNQISSEAKPEFKLSGIEEISSQVRLSSNNEYASFQDVHKDLFYIEDDGWVNYEIDSAILKNTVYSSFFPGFKIDSEYKFDTAQLWKIKHKSPELDLQHQFGSMRRTIIQDGNNKVKVVTKIQVPSRKIPVAEIPMFNKFLKLLKREGKIYIRGSVIPGES